jgi:nitrite reductase/ring-hydroxylating ferredoxin subunit
MSAATYPSGWFHIGVSDDFRPFELRSIEVAGRSVIAYRTADEGRRIVLLDAHCPHLGAHIGVGGYVDGDTDGVRCPSHGWCFGADGRCTDVPGLRQAPPNVQLFVYFTHEIDGLAFAWIHPTNAPPSWAAPMGFGRELYERFPVRATHNWHIRTTCREVIENLVDEAHFRVLHGVRHAIVASFSSDGHIGRVRRTASVFLDDTWQTLQYETECHGLGVVMARVSGAMCFRTLACVTPINETELSLTLTLWMPRYGSDDRTEMMRLFLLEGSVAVVAQDLPIWEHKIYRAGSALVEPDEPIAAIRRWSRQFFV